MEGEHVHVLGGAARTQGRFHGLGHGGHLGGGVGALPGSEGVRRRGVADPGDLRGTGGRVLAQAARRVGGGPAGMALGQHDALAIGVGLGELAHALTIGVGIEDLHHGRGIGGHGDGVAGQQVRHMLGGAGEHLVVVHEHVGPLGAGQRLAVGQQVAHGQGGQLRFQNAAGEIEDALQQPVHVGLLAGQQPVGVAVGVLHQLGPAAVEELQHLLEAAVLQAAGLHVLHDETHLHRGAEAPGSMRAASGVAANTSRSLGAAPPSSSAAARSTRRVVFPQPTAPSTSTASGVGVSSIAIAFLSSVGAEKPPRPSCLSPAKSTEYSLPGKDR